MPGKKDKPILSRAQLQKEEEKNWEKKLNEIEQKYSIDPDIEQLENKPKTFRKPKRPRTEKAQARRQQLAQEAVEEDPEELGQVLNPQEPDLPWN